MEIVLYIALLLASVGLTWIAMYGTIFTRLRNWVTERSPFFRELLSCAKCTGFWAGVILAIPVLVIFLTFMFVHTSIVHILIALVLYTFPLQTAAVCFVSELLVKYLIAKTQLVEATTKTQQLQYYEVVIDVMKMYGQLKIVSSSEK